ncbi:MAG: HlyD family efflux transporter periplasmic adaptor subunit [Cellvibrionaceae bacterium]|nr:HlyD family efflux transporter periplasmic adaptor subunit [Cellvibrionaceae bacterium]MCV6627751.1 HlyD family efflux transporter periplasmic adaptor subunit [Cellvibrionaceae bacterium]
MIKDTSAQDRNVERRRRLSPKLLWLLPPLLLLLATASLLGGGASASLERESLRTATLSRGVFERVVNASGRVVATNSPALYAAASGRVQFVKKPGEQVLANEVIGHIYSPALANQLQQARNRLQSAKLELRRMGLELKQRKLALKKQLDLARVQHTAAKRERKRAASSFKIKVISEYDYEKARDELTKAELDLENAKAEVAIKSEMIDFELQSYQVNVDQQQLVVDELARRFAQLTLHSPVTGVIGNWLADQDSQVATDQSLLTVVDLSAYEGELDISQTFADELAPGMAVTLSLAGQRYPAQLRSVSPEVQDNQVKARVVFSQNDIAGLRQNQHISARILLERKDNALLLPRGPYLEAGEFVYRIDNGSARRQPVQIGARSIDQVEVLSGLAPGDEVITSSVAEFAQHEILLIK